MEPPRLVCPRVTFGELAADPGRGPWPGIAPVELRDAVTAAEPHQRTRVRTGWSDDEWRVLFESEDTDPWATLAARDAPLFEEETVEVFFDPVGDLEGYFEIEVNPLGAVLDIVFRRSRSGYKGDWAWDCDGLRTCVRKGGGSWFAELAIPFRAICGGVPGPEWRVNFCRIDRPSRDGSLPRELTAWSPPLRGNFHTPERFGFLEFTVRG